MRTLAALTAAAASLALSACGGDDESDAGSSAADSTPTPTETATAAAEDSGGGGSTIELAADPGGALKFDKTELTAKAGKVTINFTNDAAVPHAVEVEGNGAEAKTDTITKNTAKLEADLKPGKYEFYCPVGNHKGAGMEGTLTVE